MEGSFKYFKRSERVIGLEELCYTATIPLNSEEKVEAL